MANHYYDLRILGDIQRDSAIIFSTMDAIYFNLFTGQRFNLCASANIGDRHHIIILWFLSSQVVLKDGVRFDPIFQSKNLLSRFFLFQENDSIFALFVPRLSL